MSFSLNDQPHPSPDQSLDDAYRRARYDINGFSLRIGQPHPDFDRWLSEQGYLTYLLLTAHNPASRLLSPKENKHRQQALLQTVSQEGMAHVTASGSDPHGTWPREDGLCLLDVPTSASYALARAYGQHAVVEGETNGTPRLRWLR